MPATSEDQRQAAGAALAAKRGERPVSSLKGASRQMYKGMTETQLRHYASKPLTTREAMGEGKSHKSKSKRSKGGRAKPSRSRSSRGTRSRR